MRGSSRRRTQSARSRRSPWPKRSNGRAKSRADLYVASTARDTDFIVRLSDVYPDGRSILLMDYVRRARFREGWDREVLMKPGGIVGWRSTSDR